jgi:hypothetical protein
MSKFATRLLTLTMYALASVFVAGAASAKAETSHSKHVKKHNKGIHRNPGVGNPWSAGRAWPSNQGWGSSSQPSKTCFRAFECAKWPPPFDEDPDRKASGTDQ